MNNNDDIHTCLMAIAAMREDLFDALDTYEAFWARSMFLLTKAVSDLSEDIGNEIAESRLAELAEHLNDFTEKRRALMLRLGRDRFE